MSAWVCFYILFANIKVTSIELYVVPHLKGLGTLWMALLASCYDVNADVTPVNIVLMWHSCLSGLCLHYRVFEKFYLSSVFLLSVCTLLTQGS
jgi:hypothetical protein